MSKVKWCILQLECWHKGFRICVLKIKNRRYSANISRDYPFAYKWFNNQKSIKQAQSAAIAWCDEHEGIQ